MTSLIRKLASLIWIVLGVTLIAFLLIRLAPSDPAMVKVANSSVALSEDAIQQMREQMGLTQPLWRQYLTWMGQLARGDFGVSLMSDQPIAPIVFASVLNSLQLALWTLIPSMGLALPLSVFLVTHRHTRVYTLMTGLTALGMALPSFVLGYVLMMVFSVQWHWLPLLAQEGGLGLVMPVITLVIPMTAKFAQQLEAGLYSEMRKPYTHALVYRGLSQRMILYRHALKNIAPTVVTMVLLSFGSLLGGVVVIETIFYWPGVGKLLMDAISNRDYPVVQVTLCVLVFSYLGLSRVSDWLSVRLHPDWKGRDAHAYKS